MYAGTFSNHSKRRDERTRARWSSRALRAYVLRHTAFTSMSHTPYSTLERCMTCARVGRAASHRSSPRIEPEVTNVDLPSQPNRHRNSRTLQLSIRTHSTSSARAQTAIRRTCPHARARIKHENTVRRRSRCAHPFAFSETCPPTAERNVPSAATQRAKKYSAS